MRQLLSLAVVMLVALGTSEVRAQASAEGFDGLGVSGGTGSWICNKVRIPPNAQSAAILTTGSNSNCSGGSCSNAPGNADLWVYLSSASGSAPGNRAGGASCVSSSGSSPTQSEEWCNVSSTTSDRYYWACTYGTAGYTGIQLRAKYSFPGSGTTGGSSDGSSVFYMDTWKDNLFLGIAYHRVGCLTGSVAVVSYTDYDGFSNGDYCRNGQAWQSPSWYGGSTSYQVSWSFGAGTSYATAKSISDNCNTGANNAFGTPANSYRSQTCSYNIFKNCNSDCWYKNFSNCVDGAGGSGVSIASPCW
jgi:hypothetical protein